MRYTILGLLLILPLLNLQAQVATGYHLVWHDEFDQGDTPDTAKWNFEEGYKRNHEWQYYQSPFTTPQYILLNLAMGGDNGGEVDKDSMPTCYDIDYIRVY